MFAPIKLPINANTKVKLIPIIPCPPKTTASFINNVKINFAKTINKKVSNILYRAFILSISVVPIDKMSMVIADTIIIINGSTLSDMFVFKIKIPPKNVVDINIIASISINNNILKIAYLLILYFFT